MIGGVPELGDKRAVTRRVDDRGGEVIRVEMLVKVRREVDSNRNVIRDVQATVLLVGKVVKVLEARASGGGTVIDGRRVFGRGIKMARGGEGCESGVVEVVVKAVKTGGRGNASIGVVTVESVKFLVNFLETVVSEEGVECHRGSVSEGDTPGDREAIDGSFSVVEVAGDNGVGEHRRVSQGLDFMKPKRGARAMEVAVNDV